MNMKEIKVISRDNLPTRLPLTATIVALMAIDYYNLPSWFFGCVVTIFSLLWIGGIANIVKEKRVDIFTNVK